MVIVHRQEIVQACLLAGRQPDGWSLSMRDMKKLEFRADDIPTSDYGYIHFSTSKRKPDIYLLFKRNSTFVVKEFNIETILSPNDFTLHISKTCLSLSILNNNNPNIPYNSIKVLFEVDDEKLEEIENRLKETYSYQIQI